MPLSHRAEENESLMDDYQREVEMNHRSVQEAQIDSSLPVINEFEENKAYEFIEEPPIINIEDQVEDLLSKNKASE